MRKHCSDVCKLRPCLNKESKNSARLRTIVTAALQRQYSQTELIFWIFLVYTRSFLFLVIFLCHQIEFRAFINNKYPFSYSEIL